MTKKLFYSLTVTFIALLLVSLTGCSNSPKDWFFNNASENETKSETKSLSDDTDCLFIDPTMEIVYVSSTGRFRYYYCINKIDSHAYLIVTDNVTMNNSKTIDVTPLTNNDGTPMDGNTLKNNINILNNKGE